MKVFKRLLIPFCMLFMSIPAFAAGDAHHFPEVFLGWSNIDGETDFTYALEYEYKFASKYGVGATWERTDDAHHGDGITVKLASLFYHPIDSVRVGVGYGREEIGGDHPHSEDLFRMIASYDYHFEHFSLAPTVAVDFVDHEKVVVFGIGIIKPF